MRWRPMAACTNGLGCWGTRRPLASCKKSLTKRKPPMNRSPSWRLPSATKKLWANPTKRDRRTRLQAKDQRIRGRVSVRLALAASVHSPWRSNSNGSATVARRLQGDQTLIYSSTYDCTDNTTHVCRRRLLLVVSPFRRGHWQSHSHLHRSKHVPQMSFAKETN